MAAGIVLALGTTRLWFVADVFLILFVLYRGRAGFRTHPAVLALAAIIAASAAWSPDPGAAVLAGVRILALFSVAKDLPLYFRSRIAAQPQQAGEGYPTTSRFHLRGVWVGAAVVLALQLAVAGLQLPQESRIFGISLNASQFGQTGLVFMAWPGPVEPLAGAAFSADLAGRAGG